MHYKYTRSSLSAVFLFADLLNHGFFSRYLFFADFQKTANKDLSTDFWKKPRISVEKSPFSILKIAGRKRPALVYPSHKVRQGGKGKYGYPTC